MNKSKIKIKSKKQLSLIQKALKRALDGKDTGQVGAELFIDDAADLVTYYKLVSLGKFNAAFEKQRYLDTATRDQIDEDIYYFIEEHGD